MGTSSRDAFLIYNIQYTIYNILGGVGERDVKHLYDVYSNLVV